MRYHVDYQQMTAQSSAGGQPITSMPTPAMGGVGHGNRMVLLPQVQSHACLQPTPVPSDRVFQGVFARQVAQSSAPREDSAVSRAPGGLQVTDLTPMATAFRRGIILPMGPARGRQTPMDTSSMGSMAPGGLQQGQRDAPRDRPILSMPREAAVAPPPSDTQVIFDANTLSLTYYGTDAARAFLQFLPQTHRTDWAGESWHDTH